MGPGLKNCVRSTPDVKGLVLFGCLFQSQVELTVVEGDKVDTAISGCLPRKIVGHTQSIAIATYLPCSPNSGGRGTSNFSSPSTPQNVRPGFQNVVGITLVHFVSSNGVPKSQNVRS